MTDDAGFDLAESIQKRGNFGFTAAGLLGRPKAGRAPVAIAAFLGIPLFFCSLMASTLAQEKPRVYQFKSAKCHPICTIWHDPSGGTEARIWLWALAPSLGLVLIGWLMTRVRFGFYVSCLTAIVLAMAVVHKTAIWAEHHTARFPAGIDLIPPSNAISDQWSRGEWEGMARDTALSLQHWTIGVSLGAMLLMVGLVVRARLKARRTAV